jgi:hypothetical protein
MSQEQAAAAATAAVDYPDHGTTDGTGEEGRSVASIPEGEKPPSTIPDFLSFIGMGDLVSKFQSYTISDVLSLESEELNEFLKDELDLKVIARNKLKKELTLLRERFKFDTLTRVSSTASDGYYYNTTSAASTYRLAIARKAKEHDPHPPPTPSTTRPEVYNPSVVISQPESISIDEMDEEENEDDDGDIQPSALSKHRLSSETHNEIRNAIPSLPITASKPSTPIKPSTKPLPLSLSSFTSSMPAMKSPASSPSSPVPFFTSAPALTHLSSNFSSRTPSVSKSTTPAILVDDLDDDYSQALSKAGLDSSMLQSHTSVIEIHEVSDMFPRPSLGSRPGEYSSTTEYQNAKKAVMWARDRLEEIGLEVQLPVPVAGADFRNDAENTFAIKAILRSRFAANILSCG